MTSAETLGELFDRIHEIVHDVVDGVEPAQLNAGTSGGSNSVAWLVWHLTRIQDDHVCAVAGTEQVWTSAGWADRFALPFDASATGYGHSTEAVAAVKVQSGEPADRLPRGGLRGDDRVPSEAQRGRPGRIVAESWDPPVTLGARLVSVIADHLQHVGQASFACGLLGG